MFIYAWARRCELLDIRHSLRLFTGQGTTKQAASTTAWACTTTTLVISHIGNRQNRPQFSIDRKAVYVYSDFRSKIFGRQCRKSGRHHILENLTYRMIINHVRQMTYDGTKRITLWFVFKLNVFRYHCVNWMQRCGWRKTVQRNLLN